MKKYITHSLFFFLSLAASAYTQAASPHHRYIAVQDTIPNDSLRGQTPDSVSPQSLEPTHPVKPVDPDGPFIPFDSLELIPPGETELRGVCEVKEGAVTVNQLGAAVYNLGIEVPNGGSLTPQIGLAYNSQTNGYGLAGYGFSITGISAITRGGRDLFHDGRQKGVTYTTDDNLYLDGKRLVLQSGTSGLEGAVYTLEGDPFTKVTVHGSYYAATTWFEVITRTGMTYQYGNSTDSKITYKNKKGNSRIASWYINKATDRYANYITYEYAVSNLYIRPVTITYGTNAVKSRGIVNKISFTYQSLGNNARKFVIEDQPGKIDVCLSSITATCNNSIYRKYTLVYANGSNQLTGK